ncbi:MAG: hypothetical protein KPEEDBHJ_03524 [Anaerolineales bacterium]|nr:hypothetical protein [Anaerolineales bacterium]
MTTPIPPAIAKIAPDGKLTARQVRRLMIDMVMRKGKPGAGSAHEFLRRRTAVIHWPDLRPILKGINWAFVGDVATRAYMPERTTKDLDILVREHDGETAIQRLKDAGYRIKSKLAVPGYLLVAPDETELDVIFGSYEWIEEALSKTGIDAAGYPVVRLPYLTVMKLQAERSQDWTDVSRMLGWAEEKDLDEVRAVVAKYAPEDLEDMEALIFLGRREKELPPGHE